MYLGPNPLGVGLTTCVPDPELRHISHVEARTDRNKRKVTINPRGWHVVGLSGGFRKLSCIFSNRKDARSRARELATRHPDKTFLVLRAYDSYVASM